MQTLNVDEDYQVRVIGKTFTLLKQEDIILNSMNQTAEKRDSFVLSRGELLCFEWYEHAMVLFSFLFFCLETTLQESNWMKTTSVAAFFFESIIPKILDDNYLQSSLSTITRHLGNGIWKTPYNWTFYGHWRQSCTKTFNLLLYASLSLEQA